jgi:hypothetical protein
MSTIGDLRNRYKGDRAFILGNGPSLSEVPLSQLKSEYTFGMNKINKIYDDTTWRPSFYYCSVTPSHRDSPIEQVKENADQGVKCILSSDYSTILGEKKNICYTRTESLFNSTFHQLNQSEVRSISIDQLAQHWSDDIHNKIYHYHTMYGVIQLAAYMGFSELYLLGCDLGLEYKDPHMIFADALDPFRYEGSKISFAKAAFIDRTPIKSIINGLVALGITNTHTNTVLSSIYNNTSNEHFTKDYIDSLRIHDGESVENEIVKSHIAAKRICEKEGMKIYNLTPGGELDVYPRKDLSSVLD